MNTVVRTILSLVIIAAGVGSFLWLGEPEVFKREPTKPLPPAVKLVSAEEHNDGISFLVDGVVVPYRQIEIAAQVSGKVEYKPDACRVGRAVKKGDVLLRIEKTDYELEVQRITEEVNQAEASLAELDAELRTTENQITSARAQLELEIRNVRRSEDLVAKSITSQAEVDEATKLELSSRSALQSLLDQKHLQTTQRRKLESQKVLGLANLEKAKLALQRTEILSPIDAVVVSENVEQDGYVQTGTPIITLQDTSQLDVTCKLHVKQMHWLWQTSDEAANLSDAYDFPETPATVLYELGDDTFEWEGVVNRYDGAGIDNQTRMVPCRVNVSDPLAVRSREEETDTYASPPTLMTGMFVKVRIHAKPPIPLVRIPQQAVQPGNTVWIREHGKLKQKPVSVATTIDDVVVAYQEVDGLQAGDQIIVTPLATPVTGQEVVDADNLPEDYALPSAAGPWGGPPGGPGKDKAIGKDGGRKTGPPGSKNETGRGQPEISPAQSTPSQTAPSQSAQSNANRASSLRARSAV